MRPVGRLLLTGAPGWLTEALLASLRKEPPEGLQEVRCLVQAGLALPAGGAAADGTAEAPAWVAGDLRDRESLVRAVEGIDTVFHSAAILHVRRTADWYEVNARGTERLVKAAREAGVKRFVLVSSNAAGGRSVSPDRLMREDDPPRPLSHYGRSKWLAEQAVHAQGDRLESVVVRPCMFYGPPVPSRHVEVYRRVLGGRLPLVGGGDFPRSLSYIDNLVQGCRLALAHPGAAGRTYYLTDARVYTTRQVVEAMAGALGVEARFLRLPRLVAPLAYRLDMTLAAVGLYWQNLHLVGEADWCVGCSSEKAMRELGYRPTVEIEEGMRRAVSWCREAGLLP